MRVRVNKMIVVTLLALVLAGGLVGCSSAGTGDEGSTDAAQQESVAAEEATEAPEEEPAAVEAPETADDTPVEEGSPTGDAEGVDESEETDSGLEQSEDVCMGNVDLR